jgi:hypothetical protein
MPAMMEILRAFSGFTRPGAKAALPALGHVIAQAPPREKGARPVRQRAASLRPMRCAIACHRGAWVRAQVQLCN